jgi:hypothetical protein
MPGLRTKAVAANETIRKQIMKLGLKCEMLTRNGIAGQRSGGDVNKSRTCVETTMRQAF